jgi:NitT/TauT family transport system substrate-binding protein
LLNQALIAGTFDVSFSQGSEAMIAKLRGADMRITAVVANRFNHVYLAAPGITSIKQLKGKKVAVSRFGSGSHFQSNLALKEGGFGPRERRNGPANRQFRSAHGGYSQWHRGRNHHGC